MIYLLFNEGYLSTAERAQSRDLVDDAEWLASLLHRADADGAGSRGPARADPAAPRPRRGPLRSRRSPRAAATPGPVSVGPGQRSKRRLGLLARAAKQQRPGPYQLQAAIIACHAEAERWQDTDWEQIVLLYDMLLHLAPSPVTRLHRAIALRYRSGPQAAMAELDMLAGELDRYHLYHATRADLWRELGRPDEARAADRRALELTANPAEQAVLQQRIACTYREELLDK